MDKEYQIKIRSQEKTKAVPFEDGLKTPSTLGSRGLFLLFGCHHDICSFFNFFRFRKMRSKHLIELAIFLHSLLEGQRHQFVAELLIQIVSLKIRKSTKIKATLLDSFKNFFFL